MLRLHLCTIHHCVPRAQHHHIARPVVPQAPPSPYQIASQDDRTEVRDIIESTTTACGPAVRTTSAFAGSITGARPGTVRSKITVAYMPGSIRPSFFRSTSTSSVRVPGSMLLAGPCDRARKDLSRQLANRDLGNLALTQSNRVRLRNIREDPHLVRLARWKTSASRRSGCPTVSAIQCRCERDRIIPLNGASHARERRLLRETAHIGLAGGNVGLRCFDRRRIRTRLRELLVGILLRDDALTLQALPALVRDLRELGVRLRLRQLRLQLLRQRRLAPAAGSVRSADRRSPPAAVPCAHGRRYRHTAPSHSPRCAHKIGVWSKAWTLAGNSRCPPFSPCLQPRREHDRRPGTACASTCRVVTVPQLRQQTPARRQRSAAERTPPHPHKGCDCCVPDWLGCRLRHLFSHGNVLRANACRSVCWLTPALPPSARQHVSALRRRL